MGATRADLSLGVGAEVARPALRRRLAGEARHLHRKQVQRGREAQAPDPTPHKWQSQFLSLATVDINLNDAVLNNSEFPGCLGA
jgi:hypothetical protein